MNNPIFLVVLFVIAFFQQKLLQIFPVFSYCDELLTIWAIYNICKYRFVNPIYVYMCLIICVLVGIGVYGNYISKYNREINVIIGDIGNCFKVFITFLGSSLYFIHNLSYQQYEQFIKKANQVSHCLLIVLGLMAFINLFMDIGMRPEYRYGIPCFSFIFVGSGNLAFLFYTLLIVQTMSLEFDRSIKNRLFILLAILVWLSTLRSRVFLFVIFYGLLYWFVICKDKRIRIGISNVLIGAILFYLVCYDQAKVYLDNDATARYNLLYVGYKLMIKYLPFGSGFGTFATDAAVKYYSPVYYEYGLDRIYGLSPDDPAFAHDCYWPAIMGEFGILGTMFFLLLVFYLFKLMFKFVYNKFQLMVIIFVCFTQIIASTATAVFFHYVTVWLMFFVAIILCHKNEDYLV